MRSSLSFLGAVLVAMGTASAQSSTFAPTTTITVDSTGCPTGAPADVTVTRSNVVVPSCAAGNATKPSIVSMSGYGTNLTQSASQTGASPQFTGAASSNGVKGALAIAGAAMALMI